MKFEIQEKRVKSIPQIIDEVLNFSFLSNKNSLYFRGEPEDFKDNALVPSIYRSEQLLEVEHEIFREMQRFNEHEFGTDKTAFDKLARMQHYEAPTRLLDLSEDVLSALYFSIASKTNANLCKEGVLYLLEINKDKIKYYDSDAVSVVANLAKSPLSSQNGENKSKEKIIRDVKYFFSDLDKFNASKSIQYLLHDIREEKSYFSAKIKPEHLISIFFIKPKLNNNRLHGQKGAFLLYGLNCENFRKPIQIIKYDGDQARINSHMNAGFFMPVVQIKKLLVSCDIKLDSLAKLGVTTPFIYPEMDKVANYFKDKA